MGRFLCCGAATKVSTKGGISMESAIASDTAKLLGLSMVFVESLLVQNGVSFEVSSKTCGIHVSVQVRAVAQGQG